MDQYYGSSDGKGLAAAAGVRAENLQVDAGPTVRGPTKFLVLSMGSKFEKNKVKGLSTITQEISDGVGPSRASPMLL